MIGEEVPEEKIHKQKKSVGGLYQLLLFIGTLSDLTKEPCLIYFCCH